MSVKRGALTEQTRSLAPRSRVFLGLHSHGARVLDHEIWQPRRQYPQVVCMGIESFWPLVHGCCALRDGKRGDLDGMSIGIDMSVLLHGAMAASSIAVAIERLGD